MAVVCRVTTWASWKAETKRYVKELEPSKQYKDKFRNSICRGAHYEFFAGRILVSHD